MEVGVDRLVPLAALCRRVRYLLGLFGHEGALVGDRPWWLAVENLLLPAASVWHIETDGTALDPHGAWLYSSHAAEYDDKQTLVLNDYMSALARFHFVWNAYAVIRKRSAAGRLLTTDDVAKRQVLAEYVPPVLLRSIDRVYEASHFLLDGRSRGVLKPLDAGDEVIGLGKAGLLVLGFRNHLFHGDDDPPEPDDWDDSFSGRVDGTGSVTKQAYRILSFTRLVVHLIQALTVAELRPGSEMPIDHVPFLSRGRDGEFDVPCSFVMTLASYWPEEQSVYLSDKAIAECAEGCDVSAEALDLVTRASGE